MITYKLLIALPTNPSDSFIVLSKIPGLDKIMRVAEHDCRIASGMLSVVGNARYCREDMQTEGVAVGRGKELAADLCARVFVVNILADFLFNKVGIL